MSSIERQTRLSAVAGKSADKLGTGRDVRTVGDFLDFLPRRYLDPAATTDFGTLVEGEYTVLVAQIVAATTRTMQRRMEPPPCQRASHDGWSRDAQRKQTPTSPRPGCAA